MQCYVLALHDTKRRGEPMFERPEPGHRVRLCDCFVTGVPELDTGGTVIRSDARGILVRFDSGRILLLEPGMLCAADTGAERSDG